MIIMHPCITPGNVFVTAMYGKRPGTLKSDSEWRGEWLGEPQRTVNSEP